MVSLASMDPKELSKLSDEDILARFIASAEQSRRVHIDDVALVAHESDPLKTSVNCFKCGKKGHLSRDCRSKNVKTNGDNNFKMSKKFKK